MPTRLKVYANEDDALLFWRIAAPIAGCRGFAIERKLTNRKRITTQDYLPNRIGFENDVVEVRRVADQAPVTKPSTEWPFQRFIWTDHDANSGDKVSYRVVPVLRNAAGVLENLETETSAWSRARTLGARRTGKFKPFFNRGFVMSQFMARYLAERGLTARQFKDGIQSENEKDIRNFLSGDLRIEMLKQLETAQKDGADVYAALFELSDDELIDALCALGSKSHLVLANGSITKRKQETSADARKRDENDEARAKLIAAGADVGTTDRFISPGALGHNKFMVRMNKTGQPAIAWTGSTNWSPTGLCTQVNNGLLIEDASVAQAFLDHWKLLRDSKSAFSKALVDDNSKPKAFGADVPGTVRSTVWFTRTRSQVDLAALRDEISQAKAKTGILFLMFMPGEAGLLSAVMARASEPGLYVRGVVSDLPNGRGDESAVAVNLVDGTKTIAHHFDVIEPQGLRNPIATFAAEVTRAEFLKNIGFAIIHSKVLVIDPFGNDPVVITGSHNFSTTASTSNDENFIVVRGDKELAEAYAVNILGAYEHYRWRAYLSEQSRPFNGLRDNDKWQAAKLASSRRDLDFWGV